MIFRHFREIIAWQKAKLLSLKIYRLFSKNRDFGFRDQIQRSSVSVMANIAEGYGRNSDKEFIRFLEIAKGSLNETQSLTDLAKDLGYIDNENYSVLNNICDEITKLIYGLIKKLQLGLDPK